MNLWGKVDKCKSEKWKMNFRGKNANTTKKKTKTSKAKSNESIDLAFSMNWSVAETLPIATVLSIQYESSSVVALLRTYRSLTTIIPSSQIGLAMHTSDPFPSPPFIWVLVVRLRDHLIPLAGRHLLLPFCFSWFSSRLGGSSRAELWLATGRSVFFMSARNRAVCLLHVGRQRWACSWAGGQTLPALSLLSSAPFKLSLPYSLSSSAPYHNRLRHE